MPSRTFRRPRASSPASLILVHLVHLVRSLRQLCLGLLVLDCLDRLGGLSLSRLGGGGRALELRAGRRGEPALELDLHAHGAGDLAAQLAHLAVVLHLAGRLLEANLEELAALGPQVLRQLLVVHLAEDLERLEPLAHTVASTTSAPVSSRTTKRVLMGSLNAASRIASWAISWVTPAISNSTRPGRTTATQPSGWPLPLPM